MVDAWWFDRRVCQMIIAVSQLIGNSVIISDTRFTESLSIISSYASNDKAVQVTVACVCMFAAMLCKILQCLL